MGTLNISELSRKAIHLSNIVIPIGYLYIFKDKIDMLIILSILLTFCFFIEIARGGNKIASTFFYRYFIFMMRDDEQKGKLTGATWVFVGALFTILLIPTPFSILALLFLSVGDSFAAIIGTQFPLIKLGKKTMSGSIAGFIMCVSVGLIVDINISYETLFFGAFMAMLIELIPIPIDDNVRIPIFSGFSMYCFNIIL